MEPPDSPNPAHTLKVFQCVCSDLGVPLSQDKTTAPTTTLIYLGIEFDTQHMTMRLPKAKLKELEQKILATIHCKKVTLVNMQSLLGLMNFACRVIAPGRAFCRRLINSTIGIKKPHHKIRVSNNMKADLSTWLSFLQSYNGITVIQGDSWTSNHDL